MRIIKLTLFLSMLTIVLNAQTGSKKNRDKQSIYLTNINHQSSTKLLAKKANQYTHSQSSRNLKMGSQEHKLDSMEFSYLTEEGGYQIVEKNIYEYNPSGLNSVSFLYEFNSITEKMELEEKTQISYLNSYMDEIIGYQLNDATGELEKSAKVNFEYTDNGLTDKILFSEWENEMQTWASFMEVQYVYHENEMVSSTINSVNWGGEEIDFARTDYYYNDGGDVIKTEEYYDMSGFGQMELASMTEYNYENGLLTTETYSEVDNNNEMTYYDRYVYYYNPEGTISSEVDEYFDTTTKTWMPMYKNDYRYNISLTYENTNLPAEFYFEEGINKYFINGMPVNIKSYSNYDEEWINDSNADIYYSALETYIDESTTSNFDIYPNPASDVIFIRSNETSGGICKLVDASGRVVLNQPIQSGGFIDVSSVKSGYYLLIVIDNNNFQSTIKVIKE